MGRRKARRVLKHELWIASKRKVYLRQDSKRSLRNPKKLKPAPSVGHKNAWSRRLKNNLAMQNASAHVSMGFEPVDRGPPKCSHKVTIQEPVVFVINIVG